MAHCLCLVVAHCVYRMSWLTVYIACCASLCVSHVYRMLWLTVCIVFCASLCVLFAIGRCWLDNCAFIARPPGREVVIILRGLHLACKKIVSLLMIVK